MEPTKREIRREMRKLRSQLKYIEKHTYGTYNPNTDNEGKYVMLGLCIMLLFEVILLAITN